jgi:hypothetical protein
MLLGLLAATHRDHVDAVLAPTLWGATTTIIVQAFWHSIKSLEGINACFEVPFLQAYASVRAAFKSALQASGCARVCSAENPKKGPTCELSCTASSSLVSEAYGADDATKNLKHSNPCASNPGDNEVGEGGIVLGSTSLKEGAMDIKRQGCGVSAEDFAQQAGSSGGDHQERASEERSQDDEGIGHGGDGSARECQTLTSPHAARSPTCKEVATADSLLKDGSEGAAVCCSATGKAQGMTGSFTDRMLVTADTFYEALCDQAALCLGYEPCLLLCAIMQLQFSRSHPDGGPQPSLADIFLQLLRRRVPLLHMPKAARATTAQELSGEVAEAAEGWLDDERLDMFMWLEEQLTELAGLTRSILSETTVWAIAAAAQDPWAHLPLDRLSRPAILFVCTTLDPTHLMSALEWFVGKVPSTYTKSGAATRALAALTTSSGPIATLLHAPTPHSYSLFVHLLRSMHVSATSPVHLLQDLLTSAHTPGTNVCTSLSTLHLNGYTQVPAVIEALSTATRRGTWLVVMHAHLRPDVCHVLLTMARDTRLSDAATRGFRLFLCCPTAAVASIPLRALMQLVMIGEHHAVEPHVLELLRGAADLPLLPCLQLVSGPLDAQMTTSGQLALQRVCLGLCLAVATAMLLARQVCVVGARMWEGELGTLPMVVHCMHVFREIIKRLEDVKLLDFRRLQSAVMEVLCHLYSSAYNASIMKHSLPEQDTISHMQSSR